MAERPHRTRFSLTYDERRRAEVVAESIALEISEIDEDRSHTTVWRDERMVTVEIRAADLVALRAAANTWLSLAGVADRTADAARFAG